MKDKKQGTRFSFESGACSIPHPDKVAKGGEDAFFITPNAIGVADGVSAWIDVGVDPSLYPRSLMEWAKHSVESSRSKSLDPKTILLDAYLKSDQITGSSTACIIVVNENSLEAVNLGDSGFMVVREKELVLASKSQQHSFNCPYQLGTDSRDLPKNADSYSFPLKEGDLIIVATDGLLDNLYPQEIVDICNRHVQSTTNSNDSKIIADNIGNAAFKVSSNSTGTSPFSNEVTRRGYQYSGGKPDDITVLVAKVRPNDRTDRIRSKNK